MATVGDALVTCQCRRLCTKELSEHPCKARMQCDAASPAMPLRSCVNAGVISLVSENQVAAVRRKAPFMALAVNRQRMLENLPSRPSDSPGGDEGRVLAE